MRTREVSPEKPDSIQQGLKCPVPYMCADHEFERLSLCTGLLVEAPMTTTELGSRISEQKISHRRRSEPCPVKFHDVGPPVHRMKLHHSTWPWSTCSPWGPR